MLQHCGNQQAVMGLACRFPGARGLWGGGRRPSSPPCGTCRGVYCALSICVGTHEAGVKGLMGFFPLWFPRISWKESWFPCLWAGLRRGDRGPGLC